MNKKNETDTYEVEMPQCTDHIEIVSNIVTVKTDLSWIKEKLSELSEKITNISTIMYNMKIKEEETKNNTNFEVSKFAITIIISLVGLGSSIVGVICNVILKKYGF